MSPNWPVHICKLNDFVILAGYLLLHIQVSLARHLPRPMSINLGFFSDLTLLRIVGLELLGHKTITNWQPMVFLALHYFQARLIFFIIDAVEKRFFAKIFEKQFLFHFLQPVLRCLMCKTFAEHLLAHRRFEVASAQKCC